MPADYEEVATERIDLPEDVPVEHDDVNEDPEALQVEQEAPEAEEQRRHHERRVDQERRDAVTEDPVKLKKDRDALGYKLRKLEEEYSTQIKFLEKQLAEVREQAKASRAEEERKRALGSISHLKELDPELYAHEVSRIMEADLRRRSEEEKAALEASRAAAEHQMRQRMVEERLVRDFPDIADEGSELYKEAQSIIMTRYGPEQSTKMLLHAPEAFYSIVAEANANVQLRKVHEQSADESRRRRVASQGAVEAQPRSESSTIPRLTREQYEFCKRTWDSYAYPKFEDYCRAYLAFAQRRS